MGSVLLRLGLALVAGSIVGGERGHKNRPAGLRTYVLVCLGAALATMTNLYISEQYGGDATRIPSQVISGIGFLGAGTILVTKRNQVRGLTTAAGLWAVASLGIAIGAGFYSAAVIAFFFALFALHTLSRVDRHLIDKSGRTSVYIELERPADLTHLIRILREHHIRIDIMDTTRLKDMGQVSLAVTLYLNTEHPMTNSKMMELITSQSGVIYAEELR